MINGWVVICLNMMLDRINLMRGYFMKELHIAASPLSNRIYVGHTLKNGHTWAANKQDVTIAALVAVAQHTLAFGSAIVITRADGTPEYEITVRKL